LVLGTHQQGGKAGAVRGRLGEERGGKSLDGAGV
jgi:hypothetical protein